jgi:hypothetical protein
MSDETAPEQLRQELHEIDAQIGDLRRVADDVRSQLRPDEGGVKNSEDIAADLTSIEEGEALIGILEQRRDAVLERLGELGS